MKHLYSVRACAFIAAALLAAPMHAASTLYGVNYWGAATLSTFDQSTGVRTALGATRYTDVGDLTSNPLAGTLWGIDIPNNRLLTFDPITGAGTAGPVITGTASPSGAPLSIASLAFDPGSNTLYRNTAVGYGKATEDRLFRIDPATGAATLIGANGINFAAVYALGFQAGKLFGITSSAQFIGIDTTLGTGALLSNLPFGSHFGLAERPDDGTVFVTDSISQSLYTLDTVTGVLTLVGGYTGAAINNVRLAFTSAVPQPSTLLLILAGLVIAVAVGVRRTRG